MNAVTSRIGDFADASERIIERLQRKALLLKSRKGAYVRSGIAEAAQLHGCSTARICMAEEDGRTASVLAIENGFRFGYTVEHQLNMREVLCASPARAPLDVQPIIAI